MTTEKETRLKKFLKLAGISIPEQSPDEIKEKILKDFEASSLAHQVNVEEELQLEKRMNGYQELLKNIQ